MSGTLNYLGFSLQISGVNLTNFWYSPRRDALSVSSPSKWGALLVRSSLLSVTPTTWPDAPCRHGTTATREVVVGTGLRRGSHSPHGGHHRQLLLRGAPRRPLPETRHIVAIVWQQCCLAATSGDRFMKHIYTNRFNVLCIQQITPPSRLRSTLTRPIHLGI